LLRLFVVEDDIEAANARTLDLSGTVQWCFEADAAGFRFTSLTAAQIAALDNALKTVGDK
jgi:hypothetical protein